MRPSGLTIKIASVPDRDELVAEIWAGIYQFAEIRREGKSFAVLIVASPEDSGWDIPFDELLASLKQAQKRLVGD